MMSNINVRIDRDLKEEANLIFESMGLNMSVAVTTFLKRVVADGQMPFTLRINDPLLSQKNLIHLKEQVVETESGAARRHDLIENEEVASEKIVDR